MCWKWTASRYTTEVLEVVLAVVNTPFLNSHLGNGTPVLLGYGVAFSEPLVQHRHGTLPYVNNPGLSAADSQRIDR